MEECAVRISTLAIEILTDVFKRNVERKSTYYEKVQNIILADNLSKSAFERSTPIDRKHQSFLEEHLKDVLGEYVMPVSHILTKLFLECYVSSARVFAH